MPNCANRVRNGLLGLDGVVSAAIDLERGLAFVDYVPARANLHDLILAVAADASSRIWDSTGIMRDDASQGNDGRHNYRAVVIS